MANNNDFSVVLPEAGNVIAAPVLRQTSDPLTAGLQGLSNALQAFEQDREATRVRKKNEAAAAQAERENQFGRFLHESFVKNENQLKEQGSVWANLSLPTPVMAGEAPGGPITPQSVIDASVTNGSVDPKRVAEAEDTMTLKTEEINTANEGVRQGSISRMSASALTINAMQEALATFPDIPVDTMYAIMQKTGHMNVAWAATMEAAKDAEASGAASRKQFQEFVTTGRSLVPPERVGDYTEADLASIGMKDVQAKAELERVNQELDLAEKKGRVDKATYDMEKAQQGDRLRQGGMQQIEARFGPLFTQMNKLMDEAGPAGLSPASEQKLSEVILSVRQYAPTIIDSYLQGLRLQDPTQAAEIRKQYIDMVEGYIKPYEERNKAVTTMLTMFKDHLGLNTLQAFPAVSVIHSLGADDLISSQVLGALSKETKAALAGEFGGLANLDARKLLTGDTASLFVGKLMEIVKGDNTIGNLNLTPEQSRMAFKAVRGVASATGAAIVGGKATEQQINAFRNTQMEVASQAAGIPRGMPISQFSTVVPNAVLSLVGMSGGPANSRLALDKLIKGGDEEAKLAGRGTRAAIAMNVQRLKSNIKNVSDFGYAIEWNGRDAYVIKDTQKKGTIGTLSTPGSFTPGIEVKRQIPDNIRKYAQALNEGIFFLANTEAWDSNGLKGTPGEVIAYYATGKQTKEMQQASAKKADTANRESQFIKAADAAITDLREGRANMTAPTVMNDAGVPVGPDGKPDNITPEATQAVGMITAGGFSREDAAAIVGNLQAESGSNFGQRLVLGDGGTAAGAAQWRNERQTKYQEIIGKPISQATWQDDIKFVMWELKNTHKDAYAKLKAAKTVEEKAAVIDQFYEVSTGQHRAKRQAFARSLYGR